jgi:signal transduction histidine kinase/FixJ family two-component response regulator
MAYKNDSAMDPTRMAYIDRPQVLVVDDEKRIRDASLLVLGQCGYDVHLAEDGKQGLDFIGKQHLDVVLLDLMMPVLSGFELLDAIKAKHPDTIIVVITGYGTIEHAVEAMKKGAYDFVTKPFTPDQLRAVVARAVDYNRSLKDIAETRSRIKAMVNLLSEGVMCSNHEHQVVLANAAFLGMIGHSGPPGPGCSVQELIDHRRLEHRRLVEMIDKALHLTAADSCELTDELVQKDDPGDTDRILSVRCVPYRNRQQQNMGVITVLHDITALRELDRLKSEFVSTVSHEIRGPMNSVMMQLKVVADGLAGGIGEKQREILGRASDRIASLVQMTSELLDLARIESGLIHFERETVQMTDLLQDQVNLHRPRAESDSIQLELLPCSELPPITVNRRNMEEVLSNLISNAIKYTPAGGRVSVSACEENGYLRIAVSDSGLGLTEEDRSLIFKKFYRVKNDQTRYIQGTGLGLSIVKSIVESHQGRIRVESQPGSGSTFCVFLPVR